MLLICIRHLLVVTHHESIFMSDSAIQYSSTRTVRSVSVLCEHDGREDNQRAGTANDAQKI